MTTAEIMDKLRKNYVDRVREWDDDYDAYVAALDARLGCLSIKLVAVTGTTVSITRPVGDVHYYSFEAPLRGRSDRFNSSAEDIEEVGGEALYLVVYCSTSLPLTEVRWHARKLDPGGKRVFESYDLLDEAWLSAHPKEADLALQVIEAAEAGGWQVIGPDLAEQPAPKEWGWPLPSYDYQDGEYLIRDYIIKGMRDY